MTHEYESSAFFQGMNHRNPPTQSLRRLKKRKMTFLNRVVNQMVNWLVSLHTTNILMTKNILEAV